MHLQEALKWYSFRTEYIWRNWMCDTKRHRLQGNPSRGHNSNTIPCSVFSGQFLFLWETIS